MAVAVVKIDEHGTGRWVRCKCPECGGGTLVRVFTGTPNNTSVECSECRCKFTIEWEESDESMT